MHLDTLHDEVHREPFGHTIRRGSSETFCHPLCGGVRHRPLGTRYMSGSVVDLLAYFVHLGPLKLLHVIIYHIKSMFNKVLYTNVR